MDIEPGISAQYLYDYSGHEVFTDGKGGSKENVLSAAFHGFEFPFKTLRICCDPGQQFPQLFPLMGKAQFLILIAEQRTIVFLLQIFDVLSYSRLGKAQMLSSPGIMLN
jgi:hypothetical protein